MEEEFKAKRQRGGQPGNLNALKHGFYSKTFKKIETEDLESMGGEGLEDEIEMMRIVMDPKNRTLLKGFLGSTLDQC
jgi:hypothetical protein